jgi:hypothetical protein
LVPELYRGEVHVHRQNGGGYEEVAGGECCLALEVVVVDRASVLSVDDFVDVFEGD